MMNDCKAVRSIPRGLVLLTLYLLVATAVPAAAFENQDPELSAAELIQKGHSSFVSGNLSLIGDDSEADLKRMAAATGFYRQAIALPTITAEQCNTAMFYLGASLSRSGDYAAAIEVQEAWLTRYPSDPTRSTVLFFLAANHERLGDAAKARELRLQIVAEFPDTVMAGHARTYLGLAETGAPKVVAAPSGDSERQPVVITGWSGPRSKAGPYLVVSVDLDPDRAADRGYASTASAAAKFHNAETLSWDGVDFELLAERLLECEPENVLFVMRPDTLDINLHRRILLASTRVDDDIFVDFAFGYLTASSGDEVGQLWQRICGVHKTGLPSKKWFNSSVTSNPTSLRHDGAGPAIALAAGFKSAHDYVSTGDPQQGAFVDEMLERMSGSSVVQFTGNGDPQGIWLFPGARNIDQGKHWPFSRDRVGSDPGGEMPRLLASQLRGVDLRSALVWSGTCHSAATCRVFVELDIVSTFGRTENTTVYRLAPNEGLGLALIDAGAAALLAPIGANHGMSVTMETDFGLRHGASLGEIIKSTYDDVCFAAGGGLALDIAEEGEPHARGEPIMQGGGANRILIGDPALRVFDPVPSPLERVEMVRRADGWTVTVHRDEGFAPRGWDMFGQSQPNDWRVLTRVEVEAGLADRDGLELSVVTTATDPAGATMPYALRRSSVEEYHGRRFIHLQANAPRKVVERRPVRMVFDINAR